MDTIRGLVLIIVSIMIIIFSVWFVVLPYTNAEETNITVAEKYVKNYKTQSKYMIVDTNNNTYEITDLNLKLKWNSADLYAELKEGNTYKIKTTGKRIRLLSMYKNINQIEEIE